MYKTSRYSFLILLSVFAVGASSKSWSAGQLDVVTTFTILADMVRNVGREHVRVTTLVGPDSDAHVYEPTPADARALARADVVIVNGLGFEGWMRRLVTASGYNGPVVVASRGVAPLYADEGQVDPHAWQDLANGQLFVVNITRALTAAGPTLAQEFRRNAEVFDRKLANLDRQTRTRFYLGDGRLHKVVTTHDAFQYFGRAYGIEFLAPVGISTGSEPSAREVAELVRQLRDGNVRALFVENITDPRLVEQIAREADTVVGGRLYSDSLSHVGGPASTYLGMFRHNVREIATALADCHANAACY